MVVHEAHGRIRLSWLVSIYLHLTDAELTSYQETRERTCSELSRSYFLIFVIF